MNRMHQIDSLESRVFTYFASLTRTVLSTCSSAMNTLKLHREFTRRTRPATSGDNFSENPFKRLSLSSECLVVIYASFCLNLI